MKKLIFRFLIGVIISTIFCLLVFEWNNYTLMEFSIRFCFSTMFTVLLMSKEICKNTF